jgi:hypothetical protein
VGLEEKLRLEALTSSAKLKTANEGKRKKCQSKSEVVCTVVMVTTPCNKALTKFSGMSGFASLPQKDPYITSPTVHHKRNNEYYLLLFQTSKKEAQYEARDKGAGQDPETLGNLHF